MCGFFIPRVKHAHDKGRIKQGQRFGKDAARARLSAFTESWRVVARTLADAWPLVYRRCRTTGAMNSNREPITSRRQALALAGALTVTVFTAAVAVGGFHHRPTAAATAPAVATQVAQNPAPAPSPTWRDD